MSGNNGKGVHMVTFMLLVIGGLNWLILALFGWEVGQLFGGMDALVSKIIYILVGLSAIYELATHKKCCSACNNGSMKKEAAPMGDNNNAGGNNM